MEEPTSARELFKGRHFDHEIIVLCVRWYLTFKLSSRDLVQMMAERGIVLAHTTILRWVQRYVPDFEKRWNHYARPVGDSWRVDETYIKVRGQWVYLYRAVDKEGRTADFLLSKRRDVAAAKRFFSRATRQHGAPRVITLDGYAASHRAVAELKAAGTLPRRVRIRSCKYLNNLIEQDHRRIKQRIRPMLGFKRFKTAAVTIRGIELAAKIMSGGCYWLLGVGVASPLGFFALGVLRQGPGRREQDPCGWCAGRRAITRFRRVE
jgi:transposase-like protein